MTDTKHCRRCVQDLPLTAFGRSARAKDGKQTYCKKCQSRMSGDIMAKKRALIAQYKTMVGCEDCGFNAWPEALDFDHVNDDKEFSPSDLLGAGWPRISAEIAKCEVVCANCHRHRTWLRAQRG